MNLVEAKKQVLDIEAAIQEMKQAHKQEIDLQLKSLQLAKENYTHLLNGYDLDKIKKAESVMCVTKYSGEGDQPSCIQDMIKWLSGVKTGCNQDPPRVYYGTKNYDGWSSQRCDCEWGYGPRHGSINFRVGLNRNLNRELTDEEKCACIYYLENVKQIQLAKQEKVA